MDPSFLDITANETVQQNDNCSVGSLTQSYLELKKKICKTHEVIKQYNDKLKECERLKSDLDVATKETRKVTCNYNSTLAKVIKLELQNTEYKKNIEILTAEVNEHKVKAAADQQHIQQLVCKVKDVESHHNDLIMQYDLKKSSLEMKVKELDQELKNVKKTYDMKIKKMEKKTSMENNTIRNSNNNSNDDNAKSVCNKVKMVDVGTVTTASKEDAVQKPEVSNKCIITDEFYRIKDDMYPIFCAKCEVLIEPTPLEKICQLMTETCPKLIEQISSPPKKTLPLKTTSNTVTKCCESKNLIALPETPPPHISNAINHSELISVNHLPSQTSTESTCSNYNSFPPTPSLINPTTFYIGSTPINSVSVTKSTTSQSTHCSDMSMVEPSLSIISSLQKRVDTLEKKLQKKLDKRKLEQSSNCWKHPNPYYMYDINTSIQTNFMELWKRMTDFYDRKEKEQHVVNKRRNRKLNNCKLLRLKSTKRLHNARGENAWKVETLSPNGELSSIRTRSKKRKYRHTMLLNKSDVSVQNLEDSEESVSNSNFILSNDSFTDTAVITANASTKSKNESSIKITSSKSNNDLKILTCTSQSANADELESVDGVKNLIEYSKSVNGETDSGILSDSVESGKLVQLETDLDACFAPKECKNLKDQSSEDSVSCSIENSNSTISQPTEKSSTEVITPVVLTEEITESEILRLGENVDNMEFNDSGPQVETFTSENVTCTPKRKISELQDKTKCDHQKLLKKMKNFRKCSTISNTRLNTSDYHEIEYDGNKSSCMKDLENEIEDIKEDDYIPKKKPRIAHVPKATVTEQHVSLSNCAEARVSVDKNSENKKEDLESVTMNRINANINPVVKLTNLTLRKRINSNKSAVPPTAVKENSNQELEDKCINSTNNSELDSLSIMSPDAAPVVETNDDKVSTNDSMPILENDSQIKDLFGNDSDGSEGFDSSKSPDDPFRESIEVNKTKFKLTEEREQTKEGNETNSSGSDKPVVHIYNINESDNEMKHKGNDQFSESSTVNTILDNNLQSRYCQDNDKQSKNVTNINHEFSAPQVEVQKVAENVQSCKSKKSFLFSKNVHSVNEQENNPNKITEIYAREITCSTEKKLNSQPPLAILKELVKTKHVKRGYKKKLKQLENIRLLIDKSVIKQLERLVHSNWGNALHWDVVEKLRSTYTPRIIAKNIVDYLSVNKKCCKDLDNTYTPPAPLMTKLQQKIATLIVDLEESIPMIIQLVQSGIEYKLFKMNQSMQRTVVESLARMYVVLTKIKKDRQKVRIFCCDAMYCLGLNAIIVLYTAFTCWPEAFPNNETNNDLIPKCIAHIIWTLQTKDFPKHVALKHLISGYYNYPPGTQSKNVLKELLTALQEKCHLEIEVSIKLLAKKEGTVWTYKNIIKGALLPMIISSKLPNMYRAFCLLGDLMRVFPTEDKDNLVGEIVEQLCDLISSGEGSDEQQEGVISALLSLSRHKFDMVLSNVLKWTPTAPLHDRTVEQIIGLFNQRDQNFWTGYIKKYEFSQIRSKQSKM